MYFKLAVGEFFPVHPVERGLCAEWEGEDDVD